jgi:enoyl-CoA hydratase
MPVQSAIDARGVGTITIDNTAKLNTLNSGLLRELNEAAEALGRHAELRVVVLRGAGERAFIGGADINEMATLDAETGRTFITLVHRCCDALRRLPVPVIARIQGYVLGAGLEIAASCDIRLAGAGARFGMPEVRIGIPSVIEAALLPRLIGWGRTRWLLFTGETIDAARASGWGLVEEVVPDDALDQAVESVLGAIISCGPRAIRLQKELIGAWEDLPIGAAVQRGVESFAASWRTDEPRRMMTGFLEQMRARKKGTSRREP